MTIWILDRPPVDSRRLQQVLLTRHLDCRPNDLSFSYGPLGKPWPVWVNHSLGQKRLPACNASQSGNLWAFVIDDYNQTIGIDIETIQAKARPIDRLQAIAHYFFSESDNSWLASQADYGQAFLYLWTRKEALAKALGGGIVQQAACDVLTNTDWQIKTWRLDDPVFAKAPWQAAGFLSVAAPLVPNPQFYCELPILPTTVSDTIVY